LKFFNRNKKDKSNKISHESATVIKWPLPWSVGAPMPQVYGNGHKTFLVYMINQPDPNWDGTYTTMIETSSENIYPLALVEFDGGTFRFGIANEDVFGGLAIANNGMEFYEAHIIENSRWIEELKNIHLIHEYFNEDLWTDKKHYMLLFHDERLEVIAKDFRIERIDSTFKDIGQEVITRLNK